MLTTELDFILTNSAMIIDNDSQPPMMRLQKFLSTAGICSRRKAEEFISAGRIRVNGSIITRPGTKVHPHNDVVKFDGKPVEFSQKLIYIALNKPEGYVTSCSRQKDPIVLDLLDIPLRIYPVGRLDKDSCGLLLITNDGNLHQRLSHPSFDHEKEYDVTVALPISNSDLDRMARGMHILGTKTRSAVVRRISGKRFRITLKEGRNRQIRRMVRKIKNNVVILQRVRIATIKLGNLPKGKWRHLSEKENKGLLKSSI